MIRIWGLFAFVVMLTACGRGRPFQDECPDGTRLRDGLCVVVEPRPPVSDGGVDAGAPFGVAVVDTLGLDFGTRPLGVSWSQSVRVVNGSPAPASIAVVSLSPGPFRLGSLDLFEQVVLEPGADIIIELVFTPGAEGVFEADVFIELCENGCPQQVTLRGTGVLEPLVCPPIVDFGQVPVGTCATEPVPCQSVIDDQLQVLAVTIDRPRTEFSAFNEQFFVPPRQEAVFTVEYCPAFEDQAQASLQVAAQVRNIDRAYTVSELLGQGAPTSDCTLRLDSVIDFGGVAPMTTAESQIEVINAGRLPCALTIEGIDGGQGAFQLSSPTFGVPVVIGPMQSAVIEVTFTPPDFQPYQAELIYSTDDPTNPVGAISLLGAGLSDWSYAIAAEQTAPFSPLQGATLRWQGGVDDGFADVAIPFAFEYLGRPVRFVRVAANGFVTFATRGGSQFSNQALPSPVEPNGLIALWWDDLNPGRADAPGVVTTRSSSQNGQTVLHIAYIGVARVSGVNERFSGEIRLFSGSNVIEVHYGSYDDGPGLSLFTASAGWEGFNGIRGADFLGCGSRCNEIQFPRNRRFTLTPVRL